jgi:hypothetical protein
MDEIIKTALKFICDNIGMIDQDQKSYPTAHSMPDIDNQLALDPVSLQMFLRQIVKTDESIAVVADGTLLRLVDFGQEYCLTKWGLSYNRIVDLGQNGCSTSHRLGYTESYSATQKNKYCFLNSSSRDV